MVAVAAFGAASAQAQSSLKERIRVQANLVLENVEDTDASADDLDRVLQQLRQINATLLTGNPGGHDRLFCEPRSSSYSYVTRASDGHRFGSSDVSNSTCAEIVAQSANGLVCGPRSSSYAHIYNIQTGDVIGESDVSLSSCYDLVAAAGRQLVCGPRSSSYSYVYRIDGAQKLGTDVSHDRCKEVISRATSQLVCAPRSSSYAYITRIATGETIGSDLSFSECYARLQ